EVLHRLTDLGNTVIIIEHNLDVIRNADWVIDLGPEGGEGGGRIVAEGPPEQVAAIPHSYTGQFLRPFYAGATAQTRISSAPANGNRRRRLLTAERKKETVQ
ncbi:MAG: hypothetical protein WA374_00775, partial [Acidobacteriaceae bacterium]